MVMCGHIDFYLYVHIMYSILDTALQLLYSVGADAADIWTTVHP